MHPETALLETGGQNLGRGANQLYIQGRPIMVSPQSQDNIAQPGKRNARTFFSRPIWRMLVLSLILGVLIPSAFFISDVWLRLSYVDVYQGIQPGESYKEVQAFLERKRVWCGFSEAIPTQVRENAPRIRFSDYWRDYEILFDGKTGLVASKSFYFRRRQAIGQRIRNMINNEPAEKE